MIIKENIKELIRKNLKWIILFICLIAFLAILEDVFNKDIMDFDTKVYKIISTYLITDKITPIAKAITQFGSAICLISITIATAITIKNKKIGIAVALNLMFATIINLILKNIVQRPRPIGYRLIEESGYSFPSGHSMVSTAFYGLIIYLLYKNIKNNKLRNLFCIILSILIVLIGTSRIYLGVHYASDVFAGFLISICYLIVITRGVKKFVL